MKLLSCLKIYNSSLLALKSNSDAPAVFSRFSTNLPTLPPVPLGFLWVALASEQPAHFCWSYLMLFTHLEFLCQIPHLSWRVITCTFSLWSLFWWHWVFSAFWHTLWCTCSLFYLEDFILPLFGSHTQNLLSPCTEI